MKRKILVLLGLPMLAGVFLSRSFLLLNSSSLETSTPATPQQHRHVTLLVRMRGEMANLLSHLAFAKGLELWIHQHRPGLGVVVDLVGERQAGTKWSGAVGALQQCFPNLRHLNFQGGRWDDEFATVRDQQKRWIGEENHSQNLIIDRGDSDCGTQELFCLNQQLSYLLDLLRQEIPPHIRTNSTRYSLPFLITNQLASFDVLVDQYYHPIREWLIFDTEACCTDIRPDPEEVVFHLRNFRAEMRERHYLEKGYEELNPNQLAMELLGHLPPGTRVAIASRGNAHVQPFLDALHERGLVARRTPDNHTGVQDFCFLLRAQRELIGTMRSTFTRWAALLGQAKRVQLYSIDSPRTRRAHGNSSIFPKDLHYAWKQPDLRSKIHYRVFPSSFDGPG